MFFQNGRRDMYCTPLQWFLVFIIIYNYLHITFVEFINTFEWIGIQQVYFYKFSLKQYWQITIFIVLFWSKKYIAELATECKKIWRSFIRRMFYRWSVIIIIIIIDYSAWLSILVHFSPGSRLYIGPSSIPIKSPCNNLFTSVPPV